MSCAQFFRRPAGELAPAPRGYDGLATLAPILELPSGADPFGLAGGDPLGLPLALELPLRLGYNSLEAGVRCRQSAARP